MKQPPTFTGLHLFVRDMRATAAFYRRLGFDVPDDEQHAVFSLASGVVVALGSHALTQSYNPGWQAPPGKGAMALQFDVPSRQAVDDLYHDLTAAGYDSELAPIDAFWGARYAEVLDPDGNTVGFHSPRDASMRGAPPGAAGVS
ncbi:MAG: VOC family protein [Dehalococcoidia bacterium]